MVKTVREMRRLNPGNGSRRCGKRRINVTFDKDTFEKLRREASERGWAIGRLIRFLVDASIDGIE